MAPGLDSPTPIEIVAELSELQRAKRVINLIDQAHFVYDRALEKHLEGKRLAATAILFSGGNDSTVLTHLMRSRATHAIHCNTTIGIEQTREFVRATCESLGIPLIEEIAPRTYRELVLEQGFPGPGHHIKMYQRLKERGLRQARRKLVADGRKERVAFIAGRRRQESKRRQIVPLYERVDSVIWVSPIAMWTALDLTTYRRMHSDVPLNEVSQLLHMSGECLCGSFAKPGELEEIRMWFPDVAAEIDQLQRDVAAAGHRGTKATWGNGAGTHIARTGPLCSSCDFTTTRASR
ncbi:phosphoadenosine phosphosulfate reductase family protein [Nocardia brasiliensis]|nr:phosphoadenosine phosphosulfate reductase family protein [Nocardia brasiliensis]